LSPLTMSGTSAPRTLRWRRAARGDCAMLAATSAAQDEELADSRTYLLERVGDVAIVQLYVDGFEELPLREKQLIYHLSQAAIAGRDIFIDQKYKHSLTIRDLLEEIITHPDGIDAQVLEHIRHYLKLFWVNNGPHSPITSQKIVLECSPEQLAAAAVQAEANGAKLPKNEGESTEALLKRLGPPLFDPAF